MSSFFTLPASEKKRKRADAAAAPRPTKRAGSKQQSAAPSKRSKSAQDDESISGSDIDEDIESQAGSGSGEEEGSQSESEDETAADRRLRLAERYLENVKEEVEGDYGFDAAEIDRDLIAERLREDVDESKGRIYRRIADKLALSSASHSSFRADTQSMTSVAIHPPYVYTVSKNKTLIKWELVTPPAEEASQPETQNRPQKSQRRKPRKLKFIRGLQPGEDGGKYGHTGSILSVAVSPSGQFVATGAADKKIVIWDANTLMPLKTFTHHRDSVTGLSFARTIPSMSSGEQLFSASSDRTIKTWSLSAGAHAYVETLFGHQDHVLSVDSMAIDQCVSTGARDRTARLWKVIDETQLIFRGGAHKGASYVEGSMDCVAVIPPTHFVTGSDSGAIALWSIHKKKPLDTIPEAHGVDPLPPLDELSSEADRAVAERVTKHLKPNARWITALATLPGTDIVLSGSWDGYIRAWQISEDKRKIIPLGPVGPQSDEPPIRGIVNDLAVFERRGGDLRSQAATAAAMAIKQNRKGVQAPTSTVPERKGLCIVAALGKEHRLGRWKSTGSHRSREERAGRNGAVVFEVPFADPSAAVEEEFHKN